MSHDLAARFVSRLSLENDAGASLSDTRIRLLEEIDRLGSISQASKAVPLSYKAAWDAIDILNNTAPEPLVVRSTGGRQGGGTRLTEYGRRMVAMYRALEMEYQATLDRVISNMNELHHVDIHEFQRLMQRMAMKSSARNQFSGTVSGLRDAGMNHLVHVRLDDDRELVTLITKASAENLGLHIGGEVFALFKATNVSLTVDETQAGKFTNRFWGEVMSIDVGRGSVEVVLALSSGRSVVTVVSDAHFATLGLKEGMRACACIDPETVILAVYD